MLACMKGFSSFGAILMFMVGLVMTGIAIYLNINSEIFLDDKVVKNISLSVLNGICGLTIICSIMGMCGLKKGNICLIAFFQFMVIIFFLIFLIIGYIGETLPIDIFEGTCENPTDNTIKEAGKIYNISNLLFCK